MIITPNHCYMGSSKIDLTKDTIYTHPTNKQCNYSYIHPTTKQCNYNVDTSKFLTAENKGVRTCTLINTVTVNSPSFNLKPYLKKWSSIILQPVSGSVTIPSASTSFTYQPAILYGPFYGASADNGYYCAGNYTDGIRGSMTLSFNGGFNINDLDILHAFESDPTLYYQYGYNIVQNCYIDSQALRIGAYRSGNGDNCEMASSVNVILNVYGVSC